MVNPFCDLKDGEVFFLNINDLATSEWSCFFDMYKARLFRAIPNEQSILQRQDDWLRLIWNRAFCVSFDDLSLYRDRWDHKERNLLRQIEICDDMNWERSRGLQERPLARIFPIMFLFMIYMRITTFLFERFHFTQGRAFTIFHMNQPSKLPMMTRKTE